MPIQAGSDVVLERMRRPYTNDHYRRLVDDIRNIVPDVTISTDIIVGFPGESDDDFLDTYNFIKKIDVSYLHVFTYSERPGTDSVNFNETVENKIRVQRRVLLRKLSDSKKKKFYSTQLGKKFNILLENNNNKGYIYGYTENYIRVRAPWNPGLKNSIINGELDFIDNEGFVRFKTSN